MIGRIIKNISKHYQVLFDDGQVVECVGQGKVRFQTTLMVGDFVDVQLGTLNVITKVLPRKNRLIRPSVANVDQALIVMSMVDPNFSSTLVDRLAMLIRHENIEPILIITKTDLQPDDDIQQEIEEYIHGPMPTFLTSKDHVNPQILEILKGKVSVLTGQSGAGKSTLINSIDPQFQLATQEISKALGRGKHTTRHNQLHQVHGGLLGDTPGFSSIAFPHISAANLALCVKEFEPYLNQCKFNDCIHQNEPDCAIKKAVQQGHIPLRRYEHYCQVLEAIQNRRGIL